MSAHETGLMAVWLNKQNTVGFFETQIMCPLEANGEFGHYFFPERVEGLLDEAAFKRLPGEGETSSFVEDSEDNVALIRALVKVITVSENGVEIEMRDGTGRY